MGIFSKINKGLSKTRKQLSGEIDDMLDSFDTFEDDLYSELEMILVQSDVGALTAVRVVDELKARVRAEKIKKTGEVKKELCNIISELLDGGEDMGLITIPSVILMIGVNGVGKTTTIGKMAAMYKAQGKKVLLGAADTFRAAAIDQLDVWAQRADVDIVKHKEGADPAAVVYDTIQAGIARDCDIIIIDTAGRLHNKKNLMDELAKMYRIMDKELPYADREILLVLDATTGQNGVNQAKEFQKVAELTGIVLTKLDGTAKGGCVLTIKNELKLPVKFIGVGEGLDDLQPFSPSAFAKSLFESADEMNISEEGDSLSELVNSEDYKNYTPESQNGEDSAELRTFITEVFGAAFDEGDGQEESDVITASEGQTDGSADAETEKKAEEVGEKAVEAIYEGSEKERADAAAVQSEAAAAERQAELTRQQAEAERLAAEERARAEAAAKAEAERLAAEERARAEAAAKAEAERLAEEERMRAEEQAQANEPKKEKKGFFSRFRRG